MPPLTPLVRPDRFFAERDPHGLRQLVVGIVLVLSLPVAVGGLGWIVTERFDGTVVVDNPNRPSEAYCENAPPSMAEGCDAPARVERDVDAVLWEALGEFVGPALLGMPIAILLVGGLLHGGSWLLEGENGAGESLAVALWGMVPSLFGLAVLLVVFAALLDPVTVTPESNPDLLVDRMEADVAPLARWGPLVSGATTLWGAVVWRFGLEHERGLSGTEATALAGGVAVLVWLLSLL